MWIMPYFLLMAFLHMFEYYSAALLLTLHYGYDKIQGKDERTEKLLRYFIPESFSDSDRHFRYIY